jgi:hypothetical protein
LYTEIRTCGNLTPQPEIGGFSVTCKLKYVNHVFQLHWAEQHSNVFCNKILSWAVICIFKIQNTLLHNFFFLAVHHFVAHFHPALVSKVWWHPGVIRVSAKWTKYKYTLQSILGIMSSVPQKRSIIIPSVLCSLFWYVNFHILYTFTCWSFSRHSYLECLTVSAFN